MAYGGGHGIPPPANTTVNWNGRRESLKPTLQTEQQQAEQQLVEARKEIMSEMLCRLKTEKDFDNKG